jgi:hypothetical protein
VIAIVNTVLDGLEDEDEVDIVADFSRVVLVSIMAELFDVGVEDAEFIVGQMPPLLRWLEADATREDYQVSAEAAGKLTRFLTSLMDKRRLKPGSDFISALLATGDELSIEDIHGTCILVLAPSSTPSSTSSPTRHWRFCATRLRSPICWPIRDGPRRSCCGWKGPASNSSAPRSPITISGVTGSPKGAGRLRPGARR